MVGDTRTDRVEKIAQAVYEDKHIARFCSGEEPILMLGSVAPSDWHLCASVLARVSGYKYVIVPHELSERFMGEIVRSFAEGSVLRYSALTRDTDTEACRGLLIDDVGRLAKIYRYADVVYIGGGLKGHLHNVLEPAAYGLPLVVGHHSRNEKFVEVSHLARAGGLRAVRGKEALYACLEEWKEEKRRRRDGERNRDYVLANQGGTRKVLGFFEAQGIFSGNE